MQFTFSIFSWNLDMSALYIHRCHIVIDLFLFNKHMQMPMLVCILSTSITKRHSSMNAFWMLSSPKHSSNALSKCSEAPLCLHTPWQLRSPMHIKYKRDVKLLYVMAIWMINIWDNGDQCVWDAELRKDAEEWKHLNKVLKLCKCPSVMFYFKDLRTFKYCACVACCLVTDPWSHDCNLIHDDDFIVVCHPQLTNPKVTTQKSWQL